MKFTNIHLPVALVLLLALEHHQQHHLLLGVHLLQALLLQQQLQKGLWVHDEELLSRMGSVFKMKKCWRSQGPDLVNTIPQPPCKLDRI